MKIDKLFHFGIIVPVLVSGALQISAAEPANDSTTPTSSEVSASPLAAPVAAPVPPPAVTGTDLLVRAMEANQVLYSDLQSFVCDERIERFKSSIGATNGHHIDTVTSKVSFENGEEHYSEILQDGKARVRLSSLPGAWSEGEYGTLLQQTRALLKSRKRVFYRSHSEVDGVPAGMYTFEVSEQESPWDLDVKEKHYSIPFRTDVWVAKDSGRVLKITRTSIAMPADTRISELSWSVSLQPVAVNGKTFLLPAGGEYAVVYQHLNRRDFNKIEFSNYRRYSAEATLRFDFK